MFEPGDIVRSLGYPSIYGVVTEATDDNRPFISNLRVVRWDNIGRGWHRASHVSSWNSSSWTRVVKSVRSGLPDDLIATAARIRMGGPIDLPGNQA